MAVPFWAQGGDSRWGPLSRWVFQNPRAHTMADAQKETRAPLKDMPADHETEVKKLVDAGAGFENRGGAHSSRVE